MAVYDGFDRVDDEVQCTAVVWTSKSNPSHFLATYSDGNLRIFEKTRAGGGLENRVVKGVMPDATMDIGGGCIHDAAISPCGSKLAIASKDGALRIFCAQSRQLETGFQVGTRLERRSSLTQGLELLWRTVVLRLESRQQVRRDWGRGRLGRGVQLGTRVGRRFWRGAFLLDLPSSLRLRVLSPQL